MALIEPMPPEIEATARQLPDAQNLRVAVATDLTLAGHFGVEWLLISDDFLRVYAAGTSAPRLEIRMAKMQASSLEELVGSGALMCRVDGAALEVLRYTNSQRYKFSRIVKYLADLIAFHAARDSTISKKPDIELEASEQRRCARCGFLLPEGSQVCPLCLHKGKVFLRLLKFVKPYWKMFGLVWLLMFIGMGMGLIPPYLTRPLMDRVLAPVGVVMPHADRLHLLGWLVLGLLGSQVVGQAANIVRARLLAGMGAKISHDLRMQLFTHLQMLSLRFFDKRSVGAMITRVTRDTESLETVLVDGMQHLVVNVLTLLGIGTVLFVMNWRLALLILAPAPLVVFFSRICWRRFRGLWRRVWHYRARLTASVSDTLSGMRVIKAFAKEHEEAERFHGHSRNTYEADMTAEQTWATFFPLLWLLASLGSLLVWYVGGREVLKGGMTLGTLMTFIAYLSLFYGPLQFLTRIADYLVRALTSAERVFEILDSDSEVKDMPNAISLPELRGQIEYRGVAFGYEAHKPVLKNINLQVRPGEMIGLVGRSGAGKSTLINLLCRFYDANEGDLFIDGINIRELSQHSLRSQIGIVPQDTFLFNGSIADNIRYARPDATVEELIAAAKAANAHDFIVARPEGYDSRVGERGQALSAGERQRIAIARALLMNPRILILDEATSSVDADTEKQIQEALARLVKGRTTFAIAHRLSTLRNADRLVTLRQGEIVEVGTHAELLERQGEFYRLTKIQQDLSHVIGVGI